jgi:NDP-sugar pyrophosphorylase family protein
MRGVILAAGRGKRLSPLTSTRPKHLLPIVGQPLLRLVAETAADSGIDELCVVVGYGSEMVKNALRNFSRARISFVLQREQLGTAHALLSAEEYLKSEDRFLVVYGDLTIEPEPLRELIRVVDSGYDGGLIGIKHPEMQRFGVLSIKNGLLEGIVEKPESPPPTALVNSGIYVLPREVLEAAKRISKSSRGEYELTDAVMELVRDGYRIAVHVVEGDWWLDVGRPSDLLLANLRRLRGSYIDQGAQASGEATIESSVIMRGAKIMRHSTVKSSLILEDAVIEENASLNCCIVGEGSVVGRDARLVGEVSSPVVVGPGVRVPPHSEAQPGTIFSTTEA